MPKLIFPIVSSCSWAVNIHISCLFKKQSPDLPQISPTMADPASPAAEAQFLIDALIGIQEVNRSMG